MPKRKVRVASHVVKTRKAVLSRTQWEPGMAVAFPPWKYPGDRLMSVGKEGRHEKALVRRHSKRSFRAADQTPKGLTIPAAREFAQCWRSVQ